MKRKHIRKHPRLYPFRTWFIWKQCQKCDCDFRREKGFKSLTGPYYCGTGVGVWRYLCNSCAPSFDIANNYFLNRGYLRPRPPRPTPQPPNPRKIVNKIKRDRKKQ